MTGEEAKKEIIDMANTLQLIQNTPKGKAVLMALKALEQEPCDDAISRQSAISLASDLKQDLPDDEHIADMVMAHNEGILGYQTQLSLLPPITPQLEKIRVANIHFDKEKFEEIMKNAHLTILDDSNTPTIQLIQPKTGHWIINEDEENAVHGHCSVCGWEAHYYEDDIIGMPYCPNCGCRMVEPQESGDKE